MSMNTLVMTDPADLFDRLKAELAADFHGWDFSHLDGRMVEDPLPWQYPVVLSRYLPAARSLLDLGTGGGEFLSALAGRPARTCATEGYPPNLELARRRLNPLGIAVHPVSSDLLPFTDEEFDLVINRHESYDPAEVRRVLHGGGVFVTQQVGGLNDIDLNAALDAPAPLYQNWCLTGAVAQIQAAGFNLLACDEFIGKTRFYDIGAIVYYLKCIPWQVPDFELEPYLERLTLLAAEIERKGCRDFILHRFLLTAQKPL